MRASLQRDLYVASLKRLSVALYLRDLIGIDDHETSSPVPRTDPAIPKMNASLPADRRTIIVQQWDGWWSILIGMTAISGEIERLIEQDDSIAASGTSLQSFPELQPLPELRGCVAPHIEAAATWAVAQHMAYSGLTIGGQLRDLGLQRATSQPDFMADHGDLIGDLDIEGQVMSTLSLRHRVRLRPIDLRIVAIPVQGQASWQVGAQSFLITHNLRADGGAYAKWLRRTVQTLLG